jgi:putative radical SAM enzyme (TIGR03279 family)
MIRVQSVRPGSIAEELGIRPGTTLRTVNDHDIRDALDLMFYEADAKLIVEGTEPDGTPVVYDIEKEPNLVLGVVPEPDKVRRCTNACPFCFVKGNPKIEKLRSNLYIKDDDYRLSFMFGHYVTLTNLRDDDWERIFEQRLSPLYVSVHATDPEARQQMLVNPRSSEINEHLDRLADGGIKIHAQVVLCPEVNDGDVLQRTIDDLYARGESVLSLSVVPVGLTEFNADRGIRALTEEECRAALAMIDEARIRARDERGTAWCYASDELFLQADVEVPGADYFDDQELMANGVGAISLLRDEVRADLAGLPRLEGRRIVLVTGTSMARHLAELARDIADATGALVETAPVVNELYGPMVTTAGLLGGRDHLRALEPYRDFDLALFSRTALNDDDLFLDDMRLDELRAAIPELHICPSDHITETLATA